MLFWHDEQVYALQNICIHRERELVKGVILKDRIICPGHQWAFNLETGYEEKMCRYQPTFDVRIEDGDVYVAGAARPVRGASRTSRPSSQRPLSTTRRHNSACDMASSYAEFRR